MIAEIMKSWSGNQVGEELEEGLRKVNEERQNIQLPEIMAQSYSQPIENPNTREQRPVQVLSQQVEIHSVVKRENTSIEINGRIWVGMNIKIRT
jgi:hypothetical protein